MHVFVTDIMNSYFFVTGQIGMTLGYKKRQSVCCIEP